MRAKVCLKAVIDFANLNTRARVRWNAILNELRRDVTPIFTGNVFALNELRKYMFFLSLPTLASRLRLIKRDFRRIRSRYQIDSNERTREMHASSYSE